MKKLLLMVPMLHQGGFERVCVKTARLLKDRYDVTILIFSDKDINYDISGLNVININVPARKGKIRKAINVARRVQKVRKLKKENAYDIAYSFGGSANLINVLSRQKEVVLTGLRCQTDMEDTRQVRLFCKGSDEVLSCSREIMRQLKDDFDYTKSEYIYNPLDCLDLREKAAEEITDFPFPEELTKEDHHLIVSMGRDDYIKGNWHLVKAFSLVKQEIPDARLMIFGAGSYAGNRQLARDLGIEDAVAFPGVRKNPFPYVAKSDLYVLPSNHEGFPNALLEAMALGLPVVAADCKTGPREIVLSGEEYDDLIHEQPDGSSICDIVEGTYGILVPDMSQEIDNDAANITEEDRRLAAAILKVLKNDRVRSHFAQASLERAEDYRPERYRDSLDQILSRM